MVVAAPASTVTVVASAGGLDGSAPGARTLTV
jgi:hypothetical protein